MQAVIEKVALVTLQVLGVFFEVPLLWIQLPFRSVIHHSAKQGLSRQALNPCDNTPVVNLYSIKLEKLHFNEKNALIWKLFVRMCLSN